MNLGKLAILALGPDKDSATGKDSNNPDAVAAVIDAIQPIKTSDEAKAMLPDLVNGLVALRQALNAGEAVDSDLIRPH
ncbi:MAG: hypothetical protein MO846_09810 [Candidatus Devosia symbiotica]|nr:hypothetical protein [Candidatus Devosia symbiotica]